METQRIRVLDDSALVLRILARLLGSDDRIEVVGTAANGKVALEKLAIVQSDLITTCS